MKEFTYLLTNLAAISIPLIVSLIPASHFFGKWRSLLPAIAITTFFFITWDVWFTSMAIWSFNRAYTLGIDIFGLPLEEYLFFICIPFACVFTYAFIRRALRRYEPIVRRIGVWTGHVLLVLFVVATILYHDRVYTATMAGLSAAFLVFVKSAGLEKWSGFVYLSFLPLMIPFVLVNGTLTGLFTADAVVWYDNTQNSGIRLFTIPIEDTAYALVLIHSNILLFERFESAKRPVVHSSPAYSFEHTTKIIES